MIRKLWYWLWGKPIVLVNVLSDIDIVPLREHYEVIETTDLGAVSFL